MSSNVGIAFGAVIAAGASTAVGAGIVFFPRLVKLASRRVLASSLGISAGVMTYVSFVEIFQKSVGAFDEMHKFKIEDDDKRLGRANLFATLSFFFGVLIMIGIDLIINRLSKSDHHDHHDISSSLNKVENSNSVFEDNQEQVPLEAVCPCCRKDPGGDLEAWQQKATEEEERDIQREGATLFSGPSAGSNPGSVSSKELDQIDNKSNNDVEAISNLDDAELDIAQKNLEQDYENKKLVKMGMQTAVAIALHNFPEGLATYVSVLDDPSIGAVLAIAIGIHNIPEGFCVALPVYYATGNRMKAFWWGALSGITEPIGAILGYLVLANTFSDATYGIMFGLVAGMMVMISLKELLPTAYRYDPGDTVVTNSLIAGMVIISASLVLFYL